ncbi:AAA domain-containing protein [Thermoplasmatales archaeon SCGC AB-540-F20]|nr:AAA domain-containing protein [Thermoplasmatales archaeon SCGC AB-540-F20]
MILKFLKLKNFRKFKDSLIEFPDGVTGVVGLNGAGKSTIFEAIAWVLYGSVAARTSADQIKRENAEHSDPCRVELGFIFGDDKYRVIREMSGKSLATSASATINGKLVANGAEIVSKFIQKKLGMDFKSFYTSIFAKQKELNALSSMNASERRPLILRMLGIDALDDIIKEIKFDKRNKDAVIDRLGQDLVDKNGRNKTDVYQNEIKNLEQKKDDLDLLLKKSTENITIAKKEVEALERRYVNAKKEYEKIQKNKEKLTEKKTLFESMEKLREEIKQLQSKIKDRQQSIEKQQKKNEVFKNLEVEIKTTESNLSKAEDATETIIKKIERKKTLIKSIEESVTDIDSKRKKIEKIGSDAKCPTCERVLGDQYTALIQKFDEKKQKKGKEKESFLKTLKIEQNEYERLSREQRALQKKRNYLQTQLREKERIDTTIKNVLTEINREEKEIEDKEKQLMKIGKVEFNLNEYESVKRRVETLRNELDSSLKTFQEKKDRLNKAKIDLVKKESDKKSVLQEIKNLQQKIKELEEFKKRIKEEKKNVQHLSMLNEIMSSFRTYLISQIRPTLSLYASELFDQLTDGKYSEIELDENYNLIVYDNGVPHNIERFSGGEEDLANLCIRLAISEVITEKAGSVFNFIILDEIFGSQDNIRKQNIIKALSSFSSKFRQIFLITHIEEIKNFMENAVTVLEEENGESKIKIE